MKTLIFIFTTIILLSCGRAKNSAYENKLNTTKKFYPFEKWVQSFSNGLTQYTPANCDKAKKIFDDLILDLVAIGEAANEKEKLEQFKKAILATNKLDEECDHTLIETGEREELSELINQISIASGLHPNKYGNNEGIASEWREW